MTNSCAPFSSIKICNIQSIRCLKREKLAETHMDHSKGPKRVDASHGKLFLKRTRFFLGMRFSLWYSQNIVVSSKIFSRKLLPTVFHQNLIKVKKGPFLARFRDYWMIRIFPGKTAVYVSSPYGREHSCKKSEKSLERFSRKMIHGLQTDQPPIRTLPSTDVENCNVLRTGSTSVIVEHD